MISSYPLLTGLSIVLLCVAWASLLLPLARLPLALRPVLIVGLTLLLMLPLDADPAWYAVRGIFGDSSITAVLFYIAFILQQNFSWQLCRPDELALLRRLLAVTALLLYPFALGLTGFDSYSLGYANPWLLAILFIMSLLALLHLCVTPLVKRWLTLGRNYLSMITLRSMRQKKQRVRSLERLLHLARTKMAT